jgi:hypothetical protein
MRNRLLTVLVTSLGFALFAMPAASSGSVTIGANLAVLTPNIAGYNCSSTHQCTVANTSLIPSVTASGGLASPVKGVVTSFQVRTGNTAGPIQLRVLRPAGNEYTGVGTGGAVTPPTNQISPPFPVNLPILPGEIIALNCCLNGLSNNATANSTMGNFASWGTAGFQPLGDGETREPDSGTHPAVLMVSAQVEPDNSFTLGKVKAKLGRIRLKVTVPNPGVLSAGTRLLKSSRFTVKTPGTVTMVGKPTRTGRARLSRTGKLKVVVTYTPTFGTATTQKAKAKTKPKG